MGFGHLLEKPLSIRVNVKIENYRIGLQFDNKALIQMKQQFYIEVLTTCKTFFW